MHREGISEGRAVALEVVVERELFLGLARRACWLHGAAIQSASPLGPGRALTLPCGWNNAGSKLMECKCGAANCRGFIGGDGSADTKRLTGMDYSDEVRTRRTPTAGHESCSVAVGRVPRGTPTRTLAPRFGEPEGRLRSQFFLTTVKLIISLSLSFARERESTIETHFLSLY